MGREAQVPRLIPGIPLLRELSPQSSWWARQDLNLGPMDYESTALTAELRAPTSESSTIAIQDGCEPLY